MFPDYGIKFEEFRWAWTAKKETVINNIENCNSIEEIKHVLNDPKYSHIGWWPNNLWWIEVSQIIDEVIAWKQLINNIPTELREIIQEIYNKQMTSENWTQNQTNETENQVNTGQESQQSTEQQDTKKKKKTRDENYFDWQPHEFDIENMQEITIENSQYMDNLLETINEWNLEENLNNLWKRISDLYQKVTWEELELTDDQLYSINDAHEQDWVLWQLSKPEIARKVRILTETIKNDRVRRFLLEFGFCWTLENYNKVFEQLITSKNWIKINWNTYKMELTYDEESFSSPYCLSLIENWKSIANIKTRSEINLYDLDFYTIKKVFWWEKFMEIYNKIKNECFYDENGKTQIEQEIEKRR